MSVREEELPHAPSRHTLIMLWGVVTVLLFLSTSIARLMPLALEPWLLAEMNLPQQLGYIAFAIFNAYAEGYRGFQRGFAPRVVARAAYLAEHPKPLWILLALPFCMGFFHSTRRKITWGLFLMILGLIAIVRSFPQPWRGMVDGGVVIGLIWGFCAIAYYLVRALREGPPAATDIPA